MPLSASCLGTLFLELSDEPFREELKKGVQHQRQSCGVYRKAQFCLSKKGVGGEANTWWYLIFCGRHPPLVGINTQAAVVANDGGEPSFVGCSGGESKY